MKRSIRVVIQALILAALLVGTLFFIVQAEPDRIHSLEIAYGDQRDGLKAAVSWLVTRNQNPDGGYGFDFGTGLPASNVSSTLDAILAIAGAGYNPAAPYPNFSSNPVRYLRNNTAAMKDFSQSSGGGNGKAVLALVAANQNPREFAGENWIKMLKDQYSPNGQYNAPDAFNQSLAILSLAAVGEPIPTAATNWLKNKQANDGSWDDGFGTPRNVDATSMSIMALVAAGIPEDDPVVKKAVQFLKESQLATGGWEYGAGFGENANSTALAVQALSAVGENFYANDGQWSKNGRSPLEVLKSWQATSGAFQADFGQGLADNFFATVQAAPALTGKPYPLPGRYESARRAIDCLAAIQDEETGAWEQFAGFGLSAGGTSRAVEAIAAFGSDPKASRWTPGKTNAVKALVNQTPDYLKEGRGGRVGIVTQGVVAAGAPYDVNDFAGFNLPLKISSYLSPTGQYDDTSFGIMAHSEAILGLMAAGSEVDPSAIDFILDSHQNGDWGGPDSNGIAVNILGRFGILVPAAIENLHQSQALDAGWGFGIPSDPSSTSEVIQGLIQNQLNPFAPDWSQIIDGKITNPADTIIEQQGSDGCWPNRWGPGADPFGTTDAVMLLVQEPEWPSFEIFLPGVFSPK